MAKGRLSILVTEFFLSTYTPYSYGKVLLAEAYGMVTALNDVLSKAGAYVVFTVSRHLADVIRHKGAVLVDENKYLDTLELLKDKVDYVIAIAPPIELIAIAYTVKDKLLGPSINTIKALSNKYEATIMLNKCGLMVPKTVICSNSEDCDINEFLTPLIVKPSMLAGAECTYIAKDISNIEKLINYVSRCDPNGYAVVQEYINGIHGSISAIFTSNDLRLFSLNLQLIGSKNGRVVYYGNILPIRSPPYIAQALEIIDRLSRCLNDLKGYIGIDVVWNSNGMYVVEVNPRFTTSGIGIARLYPELGKMILGLHRPYHKYLGEEVSGYAYITKRIDSENCGGSIDSCINGLVYGSVSSINEAVDIILTVNPLALAHLLYDIRFITG